MTVLTDTLKLIKLNVVDVRLCCYGLAYINLLVTAALTLTVDLTVDPDPKVRVYNSVRWKLITCWFNMISIFYQPLCLYCDWNEKQGDEPPHVETLRQVRDVVMTVILVPVTVYCDILFWLLFLTYPEIIAPPGVFNYMSIWSQHTLHTVSLIVLIIDLLLTPRRTPESMKPRLTLLLGFAFVYCLMLYVSRLNGEYVYGYLEYCTDTQLMTTYLVFHGMLTFFFYMQWPVIQYVWRRNPATLSKQFVKMK